MTRLDWGVTGTRIYEAGVDRGVLYIPGIAGVPWIGLTAVNEDSSGGDAQPYYLDGVKYMNLPALEEYEATIEAYTYPPEFEVCDGKAEPRSGLFFTAQRRKKFGFSYRTSIGSDQSPDLGYKIHLVYNALAAPSQRSNATIKDSTDTTPFSWKITATPPPMTEYKPTAHVVIDSRMTDPVVMAALETALYGDDDNSPYLPSPAQLIDIFDTISSLVIVDNGNGTWTATAPFDVIRMLDPNTFEITSPTAEFIDDDTYTISSE